MDSPPQSLPVPSHERSNWSVDFHASYTTKDVVQYALAIGFGSSSDNHEKKFTLEDDAFFEAVPTFCFVLPSWASSHPNSSFSYIQPFPTPLMRHMGVIPSTCLHARNFDHDSLPVIHIAQSVVWYQRIPIPSTCSPNKPTSKVHTLVSSRVVAVTPKSIGTFVETETRIQLDSGSLLCTMSATLLVLGMDESKVIPLERDHTERLDRVCKLPNTSPTFEWSFATTPNQALLYRMASGDFNKIHVDPSTTAMMPGACEKPILHGLCTLGIALRGLLTCLDNGVAVVSLRAHFSKPIFVGDTLKIEAWVQEHGRVLFRIVRGASNAVVVDRGELMTIATTSCVPSRL
jgi:acyl dehydratase